MLICYEMENKLIILLLIVLLVNTGFSAPPPMEPGVYGFSTAIYPMKVNETDKSNFDIIFYNEYNTPARIAGVEVRGIMGDDEYCNVTTQMPFIVDANKTFLVRFNNCTSEYRDHENHVLYDIKVSFNLMLSNGSFSDFHQTTSGFIITGPKNSDALSAGQLFFFAIALIYALIGLYLAARCIHHRENLKALVTWFIILIAALLYIFIISNIGYY
jgi:hypothetical protein